MFFLVCQALDLAAEATALKEFKDWWWKARLGKCYYKLGKRNSSRDTCCVDRVLKCQKLLKREQCLQATMGNLG